MSVYLPQDKIQNIKMKIQKALESTTLQSKNWQVIECNSGGSNSSLTLCQGITDVQNKMSGQRKE